MYACEYKYKYKNVIGSGRKKILRGRKKSTRIPIRYLNIRVLCMYVIYFDGISDKLSAIHLL